MAHDMDISRFDQRIFLIRSSQLCRHRKSSRCFLCRSGSTTHRANRGRERHALLVMRAHAFLLDASSQSWSPPWANVAFGSNVLFSTFYGRENAVFWGEIPIQFHQVCRKTASSRRHITEMPQFCEICATKSAKGWRKCARLLRLERCKRVHIISFSTSVLFSKRRISVNLVDLFKRYTFVSLESNLKTKKSTAPNSKFS